MWEVWHYKDANTELIRRAINEVNWQRAFLITNVNEKVDIFNGTILNIFSNFIPHEFVVCDDKDPPWFNKKIRALIQEKYVAFKNDRNNSSNIALKCRLKYLQACLNASIEVDKEKFYHNTVNKVMNAPKNSKVYWSLLKIFLNSKKIPIIPPLFYENRFITDFKEKDNFLIFYFLNNAPSFLIIALFLLMLTILLTNVYLQLHFQPEILEKSFKILIQTKHMDMIT